MHTITYLICQNVLQHRTQFPNKSECYNNQKPLRQQDDRNEEVYQEKIRKKCKKQKIERKKKKEKAGFNN